VDTAAQTCDVIWYSYSFVASGSGEPCETPEAGVSVYGIESITDERLIGTTECGMWVGPSSEAHSGSEPHGGTPLN
jgi:hypothetical protein